MKQIIAGFSVLLFFLFWGCGEKAESGIIKASGTIDATDIIVSARVSGSILELRYDEGDAVRLGDTLGLLDSEGFRLQLRQAETATLLAQAQYDLLRNGARIEDIRFAETQVQQAEFNYSQAQVDYNRMTKLYESNTVTLKQVEDTRLRLDVTQTQVQAAKENLRKIKNITRPEELRQADARIEQSRALEEITKKTIRDCSILSPLSGTVVKRFVENGEMAAPLSALYKISDLSTVELVVYVSEVELGKVKLGQKTEVKTDSYPDKKYEGTIIFISPEAEFTPKNIQTEDERTRLVYAVKIQIPNPNQELKDGMPADAIISVK